MEQLNFISNMQQWEYETELNFVAKELKKDLLNNKIKYECTKEELKKWYCNEFFNMNFLEDLSCEDLYFIAEETCNIKLVN